MVPLEDLFTDIISKAQRGLGVTNESLTRAAGVTEDQLAALKEGTLDEATLLAVAPHLGLHGPSLLNQARQTWQPRPVEIPGLAQFNTVFDDMTVNAYLVWDPTTKIGAAFDSGADAQPILTLAADLGISISSIFLTHTHPDHVADLATLQATFPVPVYASEREPWAGAQLFASGATFKIGQLEVSTRQTWGHSIGGITYVIQGLAHPIAIVGDALFAGSMGGGAISYQDALATNRSEIFTLPADTIICSGHGPLTTLGEEKAHNPFYPEFK